MSSAGKPRLRARFRVGTSSRGRDVMWAIAHAPPPGQAGGLSTSERALLFAVESFVGFKDRESGWSAPSVATLGAAIGVSERQAQRLLRDLERDGWIQREKRAIKGWTLTCCYRVTPPAAQSDAAAAEPLH